jgi:hypothetical protein
MLGCRVTAKEKPSSEEIEIDEARALDLFLKLYIHSICIILIQ